MYKYIPLLKAKMETGSAETSMLVLFLSQI